MVLIHWTYERFTLFCHRPYIRDKIEEDIMKSQMDTSRLFLSDFKIFI